MVRRKIKLRRTENGTMISQSLGMRRLGSSSSPSRQSKPQIVEINRLTHATVRHEDLDGFSLRDVMHLEQQFDEYLRRVRAKKEELFLEQLGDLKEKVTKVPRSTHGSTNSLEKLVDLGENSESQGDVGSSQG